MTNIYNLITFFYKHKYITILNLMFIPVLSYFIFYNLNLYLQKNNLVIHLTFNNFSNMFIPNVANEEFVPREEFKKKIKSYKNYNLWLTYIDNKRKSDWEFKNFLELEVVDDRILLTLSNSSFNSEDTISDIISYLEFSALFVNYTFSALSNLNDMDKRIVKNSSYCEKLLQMFKDDYFHLLDKFNINQNFEEQIKNCLTNQYNDNNKIEEQYSLSMKKLLHVDKYFTENFSKDNLDFEITKFMEIFDITRESIYIDKIKAVNVYTFTIFLMILSLILQYGLISFLKKES